MVFFIRKKALWRGFGKSLSYIKKVNNMFAQVYFRVLWDKIKKERKWSEVFLQ